MKEFNRRVFSTFPFLIFLTHFSGRHEDSSDSFVITDVFDTDRLKMKRELEMKGTRRRCVIFGSEVNNELFYCLSEA